VPHVGVRKALRFELSAKSCVIENCHGLDYNNAGAARTKRRGSLRVERGRATRKVGAVRG
jgi:hypothetical protein